MYQTRSRKRKHLTKSIGFFNKNFIDFIAESEENISHNANVFV